MYCVSDRCVVQYFLVLSTRQQSQTAPGGKVKRAGGETVIDNARMSSGHALLGRTTKKNPR